MYRIKAFLSPADRLVSFDEVFEGTKNGFLNIIKHDISPHAYELFSFGNLYGGETVKHGDKLMLSFAKGGFWKFATLDRELMFKVYEGISRNDEFAFGMGIDSAEQVDPHFSDGVNFVICHPGVVLRNFKQEGGVNYLTILEQEDEFVRTLEDHTKNRIARIAPHIEHQNIRIRAIEGEIYKRKSAFTEGSFHSFNEGVFHVEANRDVMNMISCIGLGDLTYLGFGFTSRAFDPRGKRSDHRRVGYNETQRTVDGYVRGQLQARSNNA